MVIKKKINRLHKLLTQVHDLEKINAIISDYTEFKIVLYTMIR